MKTMNDGNTKKINMNKSYFGVDIVKNSDL